MSVGVQVALSLGGNLGDVPASFQAAAHGLEAAGMRGMRFSSCYRTRPVGCPAGSPPFINAALTGCWPHSLRELLSKCKELERLAGRSHGGARNSPRPLDLDIIFFGELVSTGPDITIPHKEAADRIFVLVPLSEIAGGWIFPGKGMTVTEVLNRLAAGSAEYAEVIAGKL